MLNTSMHEITARQIKSLISESDNKCYDMPQCYGGGEGEGSAGCKVNMVCNI